MMSYVNSTLNLNKVEDQNPPHWRLRGVPMTANNGTQMHRLPILHLANSPLGASAPNHPHHLGLRGVGP